MGLLRFGRPLSLAEAVVEALCVVSGQRLGLTWCRLLQLHHYAGLVPHQALCHLQQRLLEPGLGAVPGWFRHEPSGCCGPLEPRAGRLGWGDQLQLPAWQVFPRAGIGDSLEHAGAP